MISVESIAVLCCSQVKMSRLIQIICLLFVQYETDSDDVRRKFEEHGEIKTFFDLISNRGMVFVTYVRSNPLN